MKRSVVTGMIISLPIFILGMIFLNARIMSTHYKTLNGFDQAAKIYGEQFIATKQKIDGRPGQTLNINVTVKNASNFIWPNDAPNPVHFSYHIFNVNKKAVIYNGLRTDLPNALHPGQEVTVPLKVKFPEVRGSYIVQLDMVQEGIAWFGEKGNIGGLSFIDIKCL